MNIKFDGKNQPYIEWFFRSRKNPDRAGHRRAWIQRREGEKDWAGTGRYLNFAMVKGPDGKTTMGTDTPVNPELSDEQVLRLAKALAEIHFAISGVETEFN